MEAARAKDYREGKQRAITASDAARVAETSLRDRDLPRNALLLYMLQTGGSQRLKRKKNGRLERTKSSPLPVELASDSDETGLQGRADHQQGVRGIGGRGRT